MSDDDMPWYRTFFDERYLRQYGPALPPDLTEREVGQIVDLLRLEPPASILDLACGHGRHAISLARRGFAVTGLDLSAVFLEKARRDAVTAAAAVDWVQADMREIPFDAAFDVVVNLFTSFGYFEEGADDLRVLRGVARALRPGGRLLVESLHRDALLRRFQGRHFERHEGAGILVLHETAFDLVRGRLEDVVTLIEGGRVEAPRATSLRLYTVPEWRRMLAEAGLAFEAAYAGLSGKPLALDSWRLTLVARRPS